MNRTVTKTPRRMAIWTAAVLGCLLPYAIARAQGPEVASVFPAGGPRGAATTVHVLGLGLVGAKAIVSGSGVRVVSVTPSPMDGEAAVRVSVAAGASLGEHELRIWTPKGVSEPIPFWVDVYPNASETEEKRERPKLLPALPVVVNGGRITAGEQDRYAFDAKEGETWVVDVNAARIHTSLDPALELVDESGTKVADGKISEGGDPRIVYRCHKAGRYVVGISDKRSRGNAGFYYRLTVGKLPVVTSVVPHGEKPGRKVAVRLEGANLGSTTSTVVSIPPDATGLVWSTVRTAHGLSLPFPLIAEFAPVVGLTETDATMPLPTLPCALEGRFSVYPSLRFAFEGKPGQTFVFAMYGRTLGSDVDGAISITDTAGKVLMASGISSGDTRLEFTPREQGIYVVEARDRQGKVGPDNTYRLTASLAASDFRVTAEADKIEVPAGGSAKVKVTVERVGGFAGSVRIGASGLPKGVTASPVVVPPGQKDGEMTFSATAAAPRTLSTIRLTATASIAGKSVTHVVTPQTRQPDGSVRPCALLPLLVVGPATR